MIRYEQGNLLQAEVEALVNTVNCVGVMGKGVALQFKLAFPQNFRAYAKAYRKGNIRLGEMLVVPTGQTTNPLYIINFPTKDHWKSKSRIEDIRTGLVSLVAEVQRLKVRSIAVPALGCGNGGLDWSQVKPIMEAAFAEIPEVEVILYEPQEAPENSSMPVATRQPKMTLGRASILFLLGHYQAISNELTMIAIQKLAYFLQVAGEPLKLTFTKHQYGPYSETLHHVLQNMEGHYIRGYGDRSRRPSLTLLPEAVGRAKDFLAATPGTAERLTRVIDLIEGFESSYGLELLATVHWIAHADLWAATDPDEATKQVQKWSKRKSQRFKPEHIHKAWHHLHERGWLINPT